jgi:hypothetical protein
MQGMNGTIAFYGSTRCHQSLAQNLTSEETLESQILTIAYEHVGFNRS